MSVYRGVVRGKVVVLDQPADLADGVVVEVRPVSQALPDADEQARERAFKQQLLEAGLIERIAPRLPDPPDLDRRPARVKGVVASHVLIEDRR